MYIRSRCASFSLLLPSHLSLGWIVVALLGLSRVRIAHAGKVIVFQFIYPYPNSHAFLLQKLTNEILRRGHDVLVVAEEPAAAFLGRDPRHRWLTYQSPPRPPVEHWIKKLTDSLKWTSMGWWRPSVHQYGDRMPVHRVE
eukprot:jgi/Botrbrau1/8069/Bobra.13_2s0035.1